MKKIEKPDYIKCSYSRLIHFDDIKFHPKNPNRHPPEQLTRIAKVMDYQGFRRCPTISTLSGCLIVGEGRIRAAHEKLGWTVFPVDYQDYSDSDMEYADMVADNALDDWSTLDYAAINLEVPSLGPDFNVDMLGIKDFVIEPAEKYDLDEEQKCEITGRYVLEVEFPNKDDMNEYYEKLLSDGLIVRIK